MSTSRGYKRVYYHARTMQCGGGTFTPYEDIPIGDNSTPLKYDRDIERGNYHSKTAKALIDQNDFEGAFEHINLALNYLQGKNVPKNTLIRNAAFLYNEKVHHAYAIEYIQCIDKKDGLDWL